MRRMRDFLIQIILAILSLGCVAIIMGLIIETRLPQILEMIAQRVSELNSQQLDAIVSQKVREAIAQHKPGQCKARPQVTPQILEKRTPDSPQKEESVRKEAITENLPKTETKIETKTDTDTETETESETDMTAETETQEPACKSSEYPGAGQYKTKISKEEWSKVSEQFEESKKLLKQWLNENGKNFPVKTHTLMETHLMALKLAPTPSTDEPDINWRGIGIWVQDSRGAPMIRLGGGFIKMAIENPKRGLFEMTRLVAQSWAPCELKRVWVDAPWEPLLKCLEVFPEQACDNKTNSEAGWAVSSALAFEIAPPGCTLPAFMGTQKSQCIKKIKDNLGHLSTKEARIIEIKRGEQG